MYSFYEKTTHIIKNHKFILNIDVLDNELNDMQIAQKKALIKITDNTVKSEIISSFFQPLNSFFTNSINSIVSIV